MYDLRPNLRVRIGGKRWKGSALTVLPNKCYSITWTSYLLCDLQQKAQRTNKPWLDEEGLKIRKRVHVLHEPLELWISKTLYDFRKIAMYVLPHCGLVKRHRVSIVVLEERIVHPLELPPLRVIPSIDETIVHHNRSAGRMLNSLSGVTSRVANC